MKAQFLDIPLDTEEQRIAWLSGVVHVEVTVQVTDRPIILHIHKTGEILYAEEGSSVFRGRFVNISALQQGEPIEIYSQRARGFTARTLLCAQGVKFLRN